MYDVNITFKERNANCLFKHTPQPTYALIKENNNSNETRNVIQKATNKYDDVRVTPYQYPLFYFGKLWTV